VAKQWVELCQLLLPHTTMRMSGSLIRWHLLPVSWPYFGLFSQPVVTEQALIRCSYEYRDAVNASSQVRNMVGPQWQSIDARTLDDVYKLIRCLRPAPLFGITGIKDRPPQPW